MDLNSRRLSGALTWLDCRPPAALLSGARVVNKMDGDVNQADDVGLGPDQYAISMGALDSGARHKGGRGKAAHGQRQQVVGIVVVWH